MAALGKDDLLTHYLQLFRAPGFKEYTWARVKELSRQDPVYRDLPEQMKKILDEEKKNG